MENIYRNECITMDYYVTKLFYPEIYQGKNKRKNYFEGWYFKIVDFTGDHPLVIIPGISKNDFDPHAFIQVLYGGNQVEYVRYDITDFWYSESRFHIMIGDNYFSQDQINLNIQGENIKLKGKLTFSNLISFPKAWYHPGIMGPFSYLPFLECYHGVINIHHETNGLLNINGKILDYQRGFGYIEKDWGRSFPKKWIWFQSNHFPNGKTTVMFSVAKVPFLGTSFTGFFAILRYDKRILLFATYTGARIRKLYKEASLLEVVIEDLRFRLEMTVVYTDGGELKAPMNGRMIRTIKECTDAIVRVRLLTRKKRVLYDSTGTSAGFEIME